MKKMENEKYVIDIHLGDESEVTMVSTEESKKPFSETSMETFTCNDGDKIFIDIKMDDDVVLFPEIEVDDIEDMLSEVAQKKRAAANMNTLSPQNQQKSSKNEYNSSKISYDMYTFLRPTWDWTVCGTVLWWGNAATGIWTPIKSEREFDILARRLLKGSSFTYSINMNVTKEVKSWILSDEEIHMGLDHFNNVDGELVPFSDGVYDVRTETLLEPSLSHRLSFRLNLNFADLARFAGDEFFRCFIDEITGGDIKVIARLLEMLGAVISAAPSRKIMYLEDETRTAASLLIRLVAKIFDSQHITYAALKGLDFNFRLPAYIGKHLVLSPKEGESIIKNLEDVLKVTDGDGVCAEQKHRDAFDFIPTSTILCAGRRLPRFADDSVDAIADLLVRVKLSGTPEMSTRSFESQLLQCKEEFILWTLDGLSRLIGNNWRFTSAEGCDIKSDFMAVHDFLYEYIEEDANGKIASSDLLSRYENFCTNAKILPVADSDVHAVVKSLYGLKPKSVRIGKKVPSGYKGIRWKEPFLDDIGAYQNTLSELMDGLDMFFDEDEN
jgi:hypothetical protein